MIRIKPDIDHVISCPRCGRLIDPNRVLWQGIHVCAVGHCRECRADIVADLPTGHAIFAPCTVDLQEGRLFLTDAGSRSWFGEPLLRSLKAPADLPEPALTVERFSDCRQAVILNCIDFLYGHVLLKLFNAERHLGQLPDLGLIVIVPQYLRWLVPDGVAEVWTVNVPLARAQDFYPRLDELISRECARFSRLWLSRAHSHPVVSDITRYSGLPVHDFAADDFRITFVWREDRLWSEKRILVRIARRIGMMGLLLAWQNEKVCRLFTMLRQGFPDARFTVAGMGMDTRFPDWIEDLRVTQFDDTVERQLCRVYGESRLVIGVHGSNLLLPSAHAGMTIDLMPDGKWNNIAQDILYQEDDPRLAAYRYRYLPLQTSASRLAKIASMQIAGWEWYRKAMRDNLRELERGHD